MRVTVEEDGSARKLPEGCAGGDPRPQQPVRRTSGQSWVEKATRAAREGYRVLALGWSEGEAETGLDFLGLVLLWDPPRPEVPDAMRRAQAAGIRVVMITGDHPATAETVGEEIGIKPRRVLTGREIDRMSADELRAAVRESTCSRAPRPSTSCRLVEALKAAGEIVAVTGDGVNDAPALKRADVGVAMGRRGSDVAREVSDLVLMDDNFATIVAAIEEGRSIYENIQKCIRFLFSANLALVLLCRRPGAVLAARNPGSRRRHVPVAAHRRATPVDQRVGNGAPALALTFDHNPGVMLQRPRPGRWSLARCPIRPLHRRLGPGQGFRRDHAVPALALPRLRDPGDADGRVSCTSRSRRWRSPIPSRRIRLNPLRNTFLHVAVAGIDRASGSNRGRTGAAGRPRSRAYRSHRVDCCRCRRAWSWAVAELVGWWLATHNGPR